MNIPMDKLLQAIIRERPFEVRYIHHKMPEIKQTLNCFKHLLNFNTIHARNQKELEDMNELSQSQLDSLQFSFYSYRPLL